MEYSAKNFIVLVSNVRSSVTSLALRFFLIIIADSFIPFKTNYAAKESRETSKFFLSN